MGLWWDFHKYRGCMTTENTMHCSGKERRSRNASYFRTMICLDCLKVLSTLNTKYMKSRNLSGYWCSDQHTYIHKTVLLSTFRTSGKGSPLRKLAKPSSLVEHTRGITFTYMLSWFNPSWQLSTTQPLARSLPHPWDGGENQEKKTLWVEIKTV